MVSLLIYHGAAVNARDDDGNTVLHKAAMGGFPELLLFLLDHSADIEAKDDKGTRGIHMAQSLDVMALLIKHGADINAKDDDGLAALHYAACEGHKWMLLLLIECGAEL